MLVLFADANYVGLWHSDALLGKSAGFNVSLATGCVSHPKLVHHAVHIYTCLRCKAPFVLEKNQSSTSCVGCKDSIPLCMLLCFAVLLLLAGYTERYQRCDSNYSPPLHSEEHAGRLSPLTLKLSPGRQPIQYNCTSDVVETYCYVKNTNGHMRQLASRIM